MQGGFRKFLIFVFGELGALPRGFWVVTVLLVLCIGIEAFLVAADLGAFGRPRIRALAYEYGGFWPGLLDQWESNYPSQPYVMFLTYGFLHSGQAHLIVNMITLWSLGQLVLQRVGILGFALLYLAALIGGGIGFGLLAPDLTPMVGASGALFGLFGGLLSWAYVDRFTLQEDLWPVVQAVAFLIGLNIAMWWAMNGQLAWQTHLGGFVAGWIAAMLIDPRPRAMDDD